MAYEHTEGIVLRKVDFSETSRIVTFITPERGRLAGMARGVRRKGSALGAALDTFNRVELTCIWKESRQVQVLTEAVVLDRHDAIKADVQRMAAAALLLDLAGHASRDNNPAPELYHALADGLQTLNRETCCPIATLAPALYAVVEAAGIAPDPEDESFLLAARGFGTGQRARLRDLFSEGAMLPDQLEVEDARLAIAFLKEYAVHQFEQPLKSFTFLREVW